MILLTGASGYLGRHVLSVLERHNASYFPTSQTGTVGYPCQLLNGRAVESLFDTCDADVVIHCAALVPKTPVDYENEIHNAATAMMTRNLVQWQGRMVLASSHVAAQDGSAYARGKWLSEYALRKRRRDGDVILRLPGLFGLPRRSGAIYDAAQSGQVPASFGPYPAMHVKDAAEYLVRAATMPSDGNREPFSVTYGDPRLEACYGSLGVTFDQRVREFVAEVQREQAQA